MSIVVRFAPSPTGYLQAGNGRAAALNFLLARKDGGQFLLRIDDTDDTRSKPEFEEAILEDMGWLGINHDLFARQSERVPLYVNATEKLKAAGLLYPCYETATELERKRRRLLSQGKPPIYDRAAMALSEGDRARFESEGRKPHWRFKLSHKPIVWDDRVRGRTEIDTSSLSDPVLVREDGRFLYTLPSVVDDIDFRITHVFRGEDHVTNTAPQIEIFEALGASRPAFAHYPLFVARGGEKLSKREGSLSLKALRDSGVESLALATYVAKIGTSDPIDPHFSLDTLAAEFSFEKIGRAPAHFDLAELEALTAKTLHAMPFALAAGRLAALGIGGSESFWEMARANLDKFDDIKELWRVVSGPVTPVLEDAPLATQALAALPEEPWDETTWGVWTRDVSAKTGLSGRALFHPLRLAITGSDHGPELRKLLPLIGRAKVEARLKGEAA